MRVHETYPSTFLTYLYSILRKPEFAGGDGAARGKIVNGFAKRPHLQPQFREALGSEPDSDEDALKADIERLMTQAKFEAVVIAERNFARLGFCYTILPK